MCLFMGLTKGSTQIIVKIETIITCTVDSSLKMPKLNIGIKFKTRKFFARNSNPRKISVFFPININNFDSLRI